MGSEMCIRDRSFDWISTLKPEVAYLTHLSPESDHDVVTKLCPPNTYPAYDGLVLTTDNVKSKYLKLNNVSLASKKDLCVYQGAELPLECNKTLYSGMGPSITGLDGDDQNMFMFYRNKSSPNCCPSTYSTSTGCVCTTQDQRDYITRRGMVSANQ